MARQNFIGLVVSQGKMQKTVKVRVQTKTYDKQVHKEVLRRKDYLVHDEGNLCKEGDIVRIEAIPKISARKYFAIAEVKVNKGQQFALYEKLAKEKVTQEQDEKIGQFLEKRKELESTITQIQDLRKLDQLHASFENSKDVDRDFLLNEIETIKKKYNIKSWPSSEPVLRLEISEESKDLSLIENRHAHIQTILQKLMSEEYTPQREQILSQLSKANSNDLKRHTIKNILRKYVLDPKNKCPVTF
ncbi:Piso0_002602 [Millerozyma farinosa CBS 7064]|uniref:Piso0_002602 protein n=1 Tax=Pichia sorbitophila (strain ATCC MYA-4447 / BCRC 22081 / CBS 7064 / NBRC 10061 / NRRL Y-12695) TaxID=559304 RepID=G8YFH3_PICSO|nr:Piso0_002602 [Millerozyma farinosa CBS 7064]